MTGYTTETVPVQPAPMAFIDVLPAAPGAKPAAIRWTPGRAAGTGLLVIQQSSPRVASEFLVVELPVRWDGRAARFAKTEGMPGTDPEATGYDVFVARNGQDKSCDCRGFLKHGHCKHVDALRCLIGNGWLDLHGSNPDADTGSTEAIEDQPEPESARPAWMDRAEAAF